MSLRETALLAAIVLTAVPVAAAYFRHRHGLSWILTLSTAGFMAAVLGVVWRMIVLRNSPQAELWALLLLGLGVPLLLCGTLFTGILGRPDPQAAVRKQLRGIALLLGLGAVSLVFLGDRGFMVEYTWSAGTGYLELGPLGKAYLSYLLLGTVFVGQRLEKAYRLGGKGADRSKLQPVSLGLFGVLGFLAYILTTGLVYGSVDLDNLVALVLPLTVATLLTGYGFVRGNLVDTSVPVSRSVVYFSFTGLVAVLYFVAMGAAAQLATLTGWAPGNVVTASFVFFIVLVAVVFLFSDRFKRQVRRFIDRNFYVHRHDYRSHWARLTQDLDPSQGLPGLLETSEEFLKDVFQANQISISLLDRTTRAFLVCRGKGLEGERAGLPQDGPLARYLRSHKTAVLVSDRGSGLPDLAPDEQDWVSLTASAAVAPLVSGHDLMGLIGLERPADPFSMEDLELLDYAAAQVAAVLIGARWGRELADAREMELLSNWSNMLLHDFKNYLSPLRMIVENMKQHSGNPEFQQAAVEDIADVTERMESLMMRLSQLRRGSLTQETVDLNRLVREALEDLAIHRPTIRVDSDLSPKVRVRGDAAMLKRVVENLVTNALQAMPETGTLSLRTSLRGEEDGRIEFMVRDTGTGMKESFVREKLFRPFSTTKRKGFGLGLYQCRSIVEAHGGEILVESKEGEGTSFLIILPGAQVAAETVESSAIPMAAR